MHKRNKKREVETRASQQRFCKRVVQIRLEQKRSRIDVAVGADLNPNYYGRIERGLTGNMHWKTFTGIKRSLEVKFADLFIGPDKHLGLALDNCLIENPKDK